MKEILPGIWHWTAQHPTIGITVSSYFVAESGTLLDPMVPPGAGLAWFSDDRVPQAIALTNRHHDRQAAEFSAAFETGPVLVPETGLHEFEHKDLEVRGYLPGEEIVSGILVHEVDAISPDDMAFEIRSAGALILADALMHYEGQLQFVPDQYMDNPEQTKRDLAAALEGLLSVDFDTLLFAHGDPIIGDAKHALRDFLATAPAG